MSTLFTYTQGVFQLAPYGWAVLGIIAIALIAGKAAGSRR